MNKKTSFKKKLKVTLCKLFWYIFVLQSLYIIYSIAPKPEDPIITMVKDFATLSGPNLVQEGALSDEYKVTIHQDLRQDLNITLEYSSTATEGTDFIAVKELHLKKGEFSKSFRIQTINDLLKEENDVYSVKIKTITGHKFLNDYNASEMSGVVFTKIVDEEKPEQSTKIKVKFDKRVYENQVIAYTLTSKKALLEDLLLEYVVSSTDVKEYKKLGEVLFKKGTKSVHFTIPIEDDNIIENTQYLEIRFKPITSTTYESVKLDKEVLKTTILDEKTKSSVEAAKISIKAPRLKSNIIKEDSKKLEIVVSSTQKILKDLPIKIKYSGKAINGQDYQGVKEIILGKNKKEQKFVLNIINDNLKEFKEGLNIELELLGNGGLESIEVEKELKLIIEDEKTPLESAVLTFNGPSHISEPELSTEYTLSLSQAVSKDMQVHLSYKGSTAKFNKDFKAPKIVTIKSGEKSVNFQIQSIDDAKVEVLEEIVVTLSSIEGGGLEKITLPKNRVIKTKLSDEVDISDAFRKLIVNKKIVFEMGSDKISKKSPHALDQIAALLKEFPRAVLVIEGHTNHLGSKKHNVDLSQRRAQKVKTYIMKKGIKAKRLIAVGYGDSQPMVSIDSPNAVELNKRVDFKVKY